MPSPRWAYPHAHQISRFRRGCIENILRGTHTFLKPEQHFLTYSFDLVTLWGGLIYLLFATTQRTWPITYNREHLVRQGRPRHVPRSSRLVAIKMAPRLRVIKCAASREEEDGVGYASGVKDAHSQWPATRGKRGRLALWAHAVGGEAG